MGKIHTHFFSHTTHTPVSHGNFKIAYLDFLLDFLIVGRKQRTFWESGFTLLLLLLLAQMSWPNPPLARSVFGWDPLDEFATSIGDWIMEVSRGSEYLEVCMWPKKWVCFEKGDVRPC